MQKDQKAFECQMCGQCCQGEGGIIVSPQDLERLGLAFNLPQEEIIQNYLHWENKRLVINTDSANYCIFFKPGEGCLIHEIKPDICKAWPFFRGNLEDRLSWLMAMEMCPGINQNIEHEEFVRQGLEYLKKHDLIKNAQPQAANVLKLYNIKGFDK